MVIKVVSPATTSVLRLVPRSENLKKVPKVSISHLPAYMQFQQFSKSACVLFEALGPAGAAWLRAARCFLTG